VVSGVDARIAKLKMDEVDLDTPEVAPKTPSYLYKYLSAQRIESILERGTVRFTPLMNTNDTFEVRSTFEKVAGPKFLKLLAEKLMQVLSEDSIHKMLNKFLSENGFQLLSSSLVINLAEQHYGQNFFDLLHRALQFAVDNALVPKLNDPRSTDEFLEQMGRELLCFSVSERMDSAPMWAHYADNNRGFVVAFLVNHAWFSRRSDGQKTKLHKVSYFDGRANELLDNPQAAIASKMADWSYEREWRFYIKEDQADSIVGDPDDPIHLLKFPPEIVDRVILGTNTNNVTRNRIAAILASKYPHARLTRAMPSRTDHTYNEVSEL
jgi:Protein of unknown function (DUF2971)